ncbi:hypothetical protein K1T71_009961 [Dendrolimus kikuchii]|uniref:Uncharacterized protein n=1 Tax=Dendrolimus kikuchii TaxID=765133 RepID=A0ACC1CTH9_9NEOP|nr:hypothetical protein K1T71_009961 [Dendrolimus kikuchii]
MAELLTIIATSSTCFTGRSWYCWICCITYISVEHPSVTYLDTNYIPFAALTTKRYGRQNPVYYVGFNFSTTVPMDNNIVCEFYFYEFLSNVYKRSFVQIIRKFCDLLENDIFFGPAIKQQECFKGPCPFPPNNFVLVNMSIPPTSIPPSFPFKKGRILLNMTMAKRTIASGYIDMEIRELKKKDDKITFSKI